MLSPLVSPSLPSSFDIPPRRVAIGGWDDQIGRINYVYYVQLATSVYWTDGIGNTRRGRSVGREHGHIAAAGSSIVKHRSFVRSVVQ